MLENLLCINRTIQKTMLPRSREAAYAVPTSMPTRKSVDAGMTSAALSAARSLLECTGDERSLKELVTACRRNVDDG